MVNNIFLEALDKLIKESNTEIFDGKVKKNEQINSSNFIFFVKSLINQKGGIKNFLMNYKETVNGIDFSSNDWEKYILGMVDKELLIERDNKRYILGTVPYANYIFTTNIFKDDFKLFLASFSETNPFKQKYQNRDILSLEDKFECLRDYINENSFSLDAAAIGGMSGATDFLQLYKYVMMEEIINKKDREEIITNLFIVLKSEKIEDFSKNYEGFINLLKVKNNTNDKRLSRLYNRLYFVFSFILNNLKPEEFPVYFSATRNTLKVFGTEGYENVVKTYKSFIKEFDKDENNQIINEYLEGVGILSDNYSLKNIFLYNKIFFENHAKYRFFQDICWIISRNILDGQDYVNNLGKGQKFNFEELKNKIYPFDKIKENKGYITENLKENDKKTDDKKMTFGEIINIDYLILEGYITENSPGEYEVVKTDPYFIRDKKEDKKTEEN